MTAPTQQDKDRSENLLPADGQDAAQDDGQGDDQLRVAEEVNLDQQGDMARRVGKAPEGIAADALAHTLKDDDTTS
jgi:hypothetical protein